MKLDNSIETADSVLSPKSTKTNIKNSQESPRISNSRISEILDFKILESSLDPDLGGRMQAVDLFTYAAGTRPAEISLRL